MHCPCSSKSRRRRNLMNYRLSHQVVVVAVAPESTIVVTSVVDDAVSAFSLIANLWKEEKKEDNEKVGRGRGDDGGMGGEKFNFNQFRMISSAGKNSIFILTMAFAVVARGDIQDVKSHKPKDRCKRQTCKYTLVSLLRQVSRELCHRTLQLVPLNG